MDDTQHFMSALIQNYEGRKSIAECKGSFVSQSEFLFHVHKLAAALPEARYALIDCRDRYHFLVAFSASMVRKMVALFPSTRAPGHITEILEQHRETICLTDSDGEQFGVITIRVDPDIDASAKSDENPTIELSAIVAHAFTSGSTGVPNRIQKTWHTLTAGASALARCGASFDFDELGIVATVPPGHSYGLETSIMPALRNGAMISSAHPLFPADIEKALGRLSSPRCLVTTPVHLKALVGRSKSIPNVDLMMCATSPLPLELAEAAEKKFGAGIFEIYGCTESGFVATRWPSRDALWQARDDLELVGNDGQYRVEADFLSEPVSLGDNITMHGDGRFSLEGRSADQVNIAGKKASLTGLNKMLMGIEGIDDGAFYISNEFNEGLDRLVLFVVTNTLSGAQVSEQIRHRVDPVFVPRRVIKVTALPRNEVGKLPLSSLKDLAHQYSDKSD